MKSDTSLSEGFVYPIGYTPPETRISDPEILSDFQPFERPYVVSDFDGRPTVDPNAPVAVRRLRNGRCPNLSSAIRYLEIGGSPDESLEATYNCEDAIARACDFSGAGFHGTAIELIRQLPKPFQQTAAALEALVESLRAQSRYEEALQEIRLLINGKDVPTEHARTLHRLEEVQLLLVLGRLNEAEAMMDERRAEFQCMYQYYGARAAVALARNDEPLARALVVKAGRIDSYDCYKILWNPLLKPIEAFIKNELLTEAGKPRVYEQNTEMHAICCRVQGALLVGEYERARNLAEGFVLHRVTDWTAAEQASMALAGLGAFDEIIRGTYIWPGGGIASMTLALKIARAIRAGDGTGLAEVESSVAELRCDERIKALLLQATRALAAGEGFSIPPTLETPLVEVADQWGENERDLFVIHAGGGRFQLCKMREPRKRRVLDWATTDLRKVFPVIKTSELSSPSEVERWIEEKLNANASLPPESLRRRIFEIHIEGWALLLMLKPSREATPLLREAWELARDDPNFYFHNGPANSFGLGTSYALRLLRMLGLKSLLGQ